MVHESEPRSQEQIAAEVDAAIVRAREAVVQQNAERLIDALVTIQNFHNQHNLTRNQTRYLNAFIVDPETLNLLHEQQARLDDGDLTPAQEAALQEIWRNYYGQEVNRIQRVPAGEERPHLTIQQLALEGRLLQLEQLIARAEANEPQPTQPDRPSRIQRDLGEIRQVPIQQRIQALLTTIAATTNPLVIDAVQPTEAQADRLRLLTQRAAPVVATGPENQANHAAELANIDQQLTAVENTAVPIFNRIPNFVAVTAGLEALGPNLTVDTELTDFVNFRTRQERIRAGLNTQVQTEINALLTRIVDPNEAATRIQNIADIDALIALFDDQTIVDVLQLQRPPDLQQRYESALAQVENVVREARIEQLAQEADVLVTTALTAGFDSAAPILVGATDFPDVVTALGNVQTRIQQLRTVQPPAQLTQDQEDRLQAVEENVNRVTEYLTYLTTIDTATAAEVTNHVAQIQLLLQRAQAEGAANYVAAYDRLLQAYAERQRVITLETQALNLIEKIEKLRDVLLAPNFTQNRAFRAGNVRITVIEYVQRLEEFYANNIALAYDQFDQQATPYTIDLRTTVVDRANWLTEFALYIDLFGRINTFAENVTQGRVTPDEFTTQSDALNAEILTITDIELQDRLILLLDAIKAPEKKSNLKVFLQTLGEIRNRITTNPNFDPNLDIWPRRNTITDAVEDVDALTYINLEGDILRGQLNIEQQSYLAETLRLVNERIAALEAAPVKAWEARIHSRGWWIDTEAVLRTTIQPTDTEPMLQTRLLNAEQTLRNFNTAITALTGTAEDPQGNPTIENLIAERRLALEKVIDQLRARITEIFENQNREANEKKRKEKLSIETQLATFAIVCRALGIPEFNTNVKTEAEYMAERQRLSAAIEKKVIADINSRLSQISNGYMAEGEANIWGSVTYGTNDPVKPQYSLEEALNNMPGVLTLDLGGSKVERPFLGDTAGFLVQLVFWITTEVSRATQLAIYAKPQDYASVIESGSFRGTGSIAFDTAKLRNMLLKDGAREKAAYAGERGVDTSVYQASRLVLQQLMRFAQMPKTPTEEAIYAAEVKPYNCFPLNPDQDDKEVVSQEVTFQWIKNNLQGHGFPDHVIMLAFRLMMAHCRHTGLEEYFDIRAGKTQESGGKTRAVRSMSRLYHSYEWAKNSVFVKGSGRDPVALEYARRHPSFGLPAEKIWLVNVRNPGTGVVEKMQVYEVMRQNLWDNVVDTTEADSSFPDNPTFTFHQHIHYAMVHYEFLFFGSAGKQILPDPSKLGSVEGVATLQYDRAVSTKLSQIVDRGRVLTQKVGKYFLDRLYLFDKIMWDKNLLDQTKNALLLFDFHPPNEYPTSTVYKDGCDYFWDNTPKHEAIFAELFASADGGPNQEIMTALRKNDKYQFTFMMFWYLVRANLERWMIKEETVHEFHNHWQHNEQVDYQLPVETVGRSHPLNWAERRAIEIFLMAMQAELPEELRFKSLTVDQIRQLFKLYNIEGNEAVMATDLKWLIFTESNSSWKKKIKVRPTLFDNQIMHGLATLGSIITGDENRT